MFVRRYVSSPELSFSETCLDFEMYDVSGRGRDASIQSQVTVVVVVTNINTKKSQSENEMS